MQKLLLVVLIGCFSLGAFAQADSTSSIVIHKDPRIDLLVKKQSQINEETTREARRSVPGFRIQVINTSDRNAAINAKTKVYQLYPELKAYLLYQSPYFRLRVGNFKDKEEADDYVKALSKQFGNVYLVRDIVEIKPEN
jgi:hypothetical protein